MLLLHVSEKLQSSQVLFTAFLDWPISLLRGGYDVSLTIPWPQGCRCIFLWFYPRGLLICLSYAFDLCLNPSARKPSRGAGHSLTIVLHCTCLRPFVAGEGRKEGGRKEKEGRGKGKEEKGKEGDREGREERKKCFIFCKYKSKDIHTNHKNWLISLHQN